MYRNAIERETLKVSGIFHLKNVHGRPRGATVAGSLSRIGGATGSVARARLELVLPVCAASFPSDFEVCDDELDRLFDGAVSAFLR